MTRSKLAHQSFPFLSTLRGVGWLSSLSLLSSGVVMAQSSPGGSVPTVAPESLSTVVSQPSAAMPAVPLVPELPESQFAVPSKAAPVAPRLKLTQPTQQPTDFDTGPDTIVLKERSTGCQAVLAAGQAVPNGVCAPAIAPVARTGRSLSGATAYGGLSIVDPINQVSDRASSSRVLSSLLNVYNRTVRPPARLGNGNIRLLFPLSIPAPISSLFGWRIHPITGDQRFHAGTDLAAPLGTPVLAAYAGQVVLADWLGGYGLAVALEHNKGTQQTLYGHLSELFVRPGEVVKQGEVIGRVGSTGNSTGPHLHFEFRQLTPEGWVAMDAGEQLEYALAQLVKALQVAQSKSNRG